MDYSWVTSRNETRKMSERSPSLTGSMSNVSQVSQGSGNSAKRIKSTVDIVQLIQNNYGISLPKKCETRLLEACLLTKEDVDAAMQQLRDGNDLEVCGGSVKLEADTVEQLYHLTKHRHELTLTTKPTPKWTAEEFEKASELMELMTEKSTKVRQTLSFVAELAEDLALVDLDRANA